jgi:cytochrome oxidase assembly protein ShyY1
MIRRLPLIPTLVVAAAAAVMIALGFWQLRRAEWKESLLARYQHAATMPPIAWPTMPPKDDQLPLFRHATGVCLQIVGRRAVAGASASGEPGYAHIVDCATGGMEGPGMSVQIGWSRNPNAKGQWTGGPVSGIIAPDQRSRMRLVAATPAPGLQPSAPPSIATISNNHRLYAIQWFSFAAIALLIYGLALRKRLKSEPPE